MSSKCIKSPVFPILIIVCLIHQSPSLAATLYVPRAYPTIQGAVDAAVDGDEIEVAPGTYYEHIDFLGKAVRLYSSQGAAVTKIDGNGASGIPGNVIRCISGEDSSTILEGFVISGGRAYPEVSGVSKSGGGMWNDGSSPTVIGCIFINNYAGTNGGGMYNVSNSSPTVIRCSFIDNIAEWHGGGMSNDSNSSPAVTDCKFINNWVQHSGGGMSNRFNSNTKVIQCTFFGNWVDSYEGGGGMSNHSSNPSIMNCTFSDNVAVRHPGNGMYTVDGGNPTVVNSIFWSNAGDEILGPASISYCCVKGGCPGEGNIDNNPLFVGKGDCHLTSASPCINAGNNSAVARTDLDGNPRIQGSEVDMGAYEFQTLDAAKETLTEVGEIIRGLPAESFVSENNILAFSNQITAVLTMISEGLSREALYNLEKDILKRTDGCVEIGGPDINDWILTCEDQAKVYPKILKTIELLRSYWENNTTLSSYRSMGGRI